MSDLNDLSRADLVQAAKVAGVKASGRNEEIIERIEAKRAEGPASSSVDGARQEGGSDTEPNGSDATLTADAAETAPDPVAESGDVLPIRRETDAAWWCPHCDNSQTQTLQECGGCGAVRDGDMVVVA